MYRPPNFPSWDRRGSEPRNEASGVVPNRRERSEPPLKSRDSASLVLIRSAARKFKEARCARVYSVPPHSPRSSARCPSYPRRGRLLADGLSCRLLGQAPVQEGKCARPRCRRLALHSCPESEPTVSAGNSRRVKRAESLEAKSMIFD